MSSALHLLLTALLWLSMGLWPVRAEATEQDGEAHACRSDQHAPDIGNTSESPEPIEIEDEDDDTATATRSSSEPQPVQDPRSSDRPGSATRAREISMVGAGSIRGPPDTCP